VGSFLGTLVIRLPAGRPFVAGRSICEACGRTLRARELMPLASWIVQRGRCAQCGSSLSWFYPGIEIAALGVALGAAVLTSGGFAFVASCGLGWLLVVQAAIDLRACSLRDGLGLSLLGLCTWLAWLTTVGGLSW
jgi:leader peptidase (prepilin peptidase)/N-methyltransferase